MKYSAEVNGTWRCHDSQHNDTQRGDIQQNNTQHENTQHNIENYVALSKTPSIWSHCTECHIFYCVVLLNVVTLSVVALAITGQSSKQLLTVNRQ